MNLVRQNPAYLTLLAGTLLVLPISAEAQPPLPCKPVVQSNARSRVSLVAAENPAPAADQSGDNLQPVPRSKPLPPVRSVCGCRGWYDNRVCTDECIGLNYGPFIYYGTSALDDDWTNDFKSCFEEDCGGDHGVKLTLWWIRMHHDWDGWSNIGRRDRGRLFGRGDGHFFD